MKQKIRILKESLARQKSLSAAYNKEINRRVRNKFTMEKEVGKLLKNLRLILGDGAVALALKGTKLEYSYGTTGDHVCMKRKKAGGSL